MSFWLHTGPLDEAKRYADLPATQRAAIKKQYNDAGVKLMISAFGSTEQPTTQGFDPVKTANDLADFALQVGVDGVDIDYEDLDAMNKKDGSAEKWLITFMKTLRQKLPTGKFLVSHAPIGPWFSPIFTSGAYIAVDKAVGNLIDFYNIQVSRQIAEVT
jgi:chitinase